MELNAYELIETGHGIKEFRINAHTKFNETKSHKFDYLVMNNRDVDYWKKNDIGETYYNILKNSNVTFFQAVKKGVLEITTYRTI